MSDYGSYVIYAPELVVDGGWLAVDGGWLAV